MVGIRNNKEISFTYFLDDIFKRATEQSAFFAKDKINQQGQTLIDDIIISDDEKVFAEKAFKKSSLDVLEMLDELTSGIKKPLFADGEIIRLTIKANTNEMGKLITRESRLHIVDASIGNYLESYILAQWYSMKGFSDMYNHECDKMLHAKGELTAHVKRLRRSYVGRSYLGSF
ncbi:MAG: hypothetical protein R3Y26_05285 [Rikenellaceae bacterium]